ncbi:hypothetical protein EJ08DRAFT_676824 [Tothia fuscella]|uniref:Uncharacterized protein n=1 Tax=Tothia fuscella TaxID=1048955 RepID=A0A9P4U1B1_9PEZI|nr:hypothetical protein EJ08DRAFT_676824 [Tothia fuscella]
MSFAPYHDVDSKTAMDELVLPEHAIAVLAQRQRKRACVRRQIKRIFFILGSFSLIIFLFPTLARKTGEYFGMKMHKQNEWPNLCHNLESTRSLTFEFENLQKKFDFTEVFDRSNQQHGCQQLHSGRALRSAIQLLPAPQDQKFDIVVSVSLNASNEILTESVTWESSDDSLVLKLPSLWQGCLMVDVDVFVRQNLALDTFSITANASSVDIPTALGLLVNKQTNINLNAGSLSAYPFLQSRKTRIVLDAGSLNGDYGLYDVLDIYAKAGVVLANITPQPADNENPAPANLTVGTGAGGININYPPKSMKEKIPERDYYTTITTKQGSIRGCYLHGKNTTVSTSQGEILADILPYAADSSESTLDTSTGAGAHSLKVRSPYLNPDTPIKRLNSKHCTSVSSLTLEYPPEWEGTIEGKVNVGSLSVSGDGLRVIEKGKIGVVGQFIRAEKGGGNSTIDFSSEVGRASLSVG